MSILLNLDSKYIQKVVFTLNELLFIEGFTSTEASDHTTHTDAIGQFEMQTRTWRAGLLFIFYMTFPQLFDQSCIHY